MLMGRLKFENCPFQYIKTRKLENLHFSTVLVKKLEIFSSFRF